MSYTFYLFIDVFTANNCKTVTVNFTVIYIRLQAIALLHIPALRVVGVRGQGQHWYSAPEAVLWFRVFAQSLTLAIDIPESNL